MRRRKAAKRSRTVRIILGLLVVAGAVGTFWVGRLVGPASSSRRPTIVRVPAGTRAGPLGQRLERLGLIRSARAFALYAALSGYETRIRAGEYRLRPDMSVRQILARTSRGGSDVTDRVVTVPPGFTVRQIADVLAAQGIVRSRADFVRVARDPLRWARTSFALPSSGLEGYLYPDTYRFLPNTRPERVAQAMLDNFERRFNAPYRADIARSGHSLGALVTIASLIEREAETPQDRPRIAGVIENRLRKRMRLEIDATVLYALGRHKTRVLYSDLRVDSPYNTYRHAGLPPGPIASPGLDSLRAALHPANHAFLYYVAAPDGSHVFSQTLAEHLRNKARMVQLRRRTARARNG